MINAALTGFLTGLSLIVAIGAQNAFVLRQGLWRRHVLAVVLACAFSDALLISVGVYASAQISQRIPALLPLMRWGGAAFLTVYGAKAAWAAYKGGEHLDAARNDAARDSQSLRAALLTCLALTWLNPHVYLDTVVLLGAISARFAEARAGFALGAVTASFLFFFALGYGARLLQPLFARPRAWQLLDALIALVMWKIALSLVLAG
ncbi:LysE/ArgO family amino acid transporter [Celeribacter neptunius]|uniref:L-lysine exporter family protein LysE/ArgO n=1 Tax=Celeribacter neptunius TaxID=588602 RepID=A0A1I3WM73_9RHOB|nr:LysE/ArgO family amino acid transporter [Celeribacter neptunius]SFK07561.1 L-lysine exporter family protein LysE/ArgO [Celeribacter neptunius]